jgi:hypothetical protein
MNAKKAAAVGAVSLIVVIVGAEGRQNSREEWREPAVTATHISVATGQFVAVASGSAGSRFTFVASPAQRFTNALEPLSVLGPMVQPSS